MSYLALCCGSVLLNNETCQCKKCNTMGGSPNGYYLIKSQDFIMIYRNYFDLLTLSQGVKPNVKKTEDYIIGRLHLDFSINEFEGFQCS